MQTFANLRLKLVVGAVAAMTEADVERGCAELEDDDEDESEYDEEAEADRRHEAEEKKKAEKARQEVIDTICVFIAFIIIIAASIGSTTIQSF